MMLLRPLYGGQEKLIKHILKDLIISRILSALRHSLPKLGASIIKVCLYCTHLSAIMDVLLRLVPCLGIKFRYLHLL
ncbi:hypothetical protein D364_23880 [Klebsiella pneumoniae CG43]|nr:hypothetical protein D364_23880 [Klebsiella pneumoniae CG43]ARN28383.1 hypothetical protein A4U70_23130 [Klebsiella pneumoniae]